MTINIIHSLTSMEIEVVFRDTSSNAFSRLVDSLSHRLSGQEQSIDISMTCSDRAHTVTRYTVTHPGAIVSLLKAMDPYYGGVRPLKQSDLIENDASGNDKVSVMHKTRILSVPIGRSTVLNVKREEAHATIGLIQLIKNVQERLRAGDCKITCRCKNRKSYIDSDSVGRIDATVVRSGVISSVEGIDVGKLVPRYEVEYELLRLPEGIDANDREIFQMESTIEKITNIVSPRVSEIEHIIVGHVTMGDIIREYGALGKTSRRLVGPDVVTLERLNMMAYEETPPDIASLREPDGYVATPKADGRRHSLFLGTNGVAYLIDNTMNVQHCGRIRTPEDSGSLLLPAILDCEVIKQDSGEFLVLVFDVYFVGGRAIWNQPFHKDRRMAMSNIVGRVHADPGYYITCKSFYDAHDIREAAAALLNAHRIGLVREERSYITDGIVFVPKYRPITSLTGKWSRMLKWKPPNMNSIDLQVDIVNGIAYLYCGFSYHLENLDPETVISGMLQKMPATAGGGDGRETRGKRIFDPCPEYHGQLMCKDGSVIRAQDVVEFTFATDDSTGSFTAIPMRVRQDKRHGNDYQVALNIWRTIMEPVTEDHITGREDVVIDNVQEALNSNESYANRYSMREIQRENLGTRMIAKFHNFVKNSMLETAIKHAPSNTIGGRNDHARPPALLDLTCGQGQDCWKWFNLGIEFAFGIDLYSDNIVNPRDGAYSRFKRLIESSKHPKKVYYLFAAADSGKRFTTASLNAQKNISQFNRALIRSATSKSAAPDALKSLPYLPRAPESYGVVTAMFSLHYFWKDARTLDTFLDNVSSNLSSGGGRFIACCFDGDTVHAAFESGGGSNRLFSTNDGHASNRGITWSVERKYTGPFPAASGKSTGFKIDVYIDSINKTTSEYLVHVPHLKELCEKRGMRLVRHEMFTSDTFLGTWTKQSQANFLSRDDTLFTSLNCCIEFVKE